MTDRVAWSFDLPPMSLDLPTEVIDRIARAVVARIAEQVPAWLPDRPLTTDEAADWLNVDPSTLRRWRREGVLRPFVYGQTILYTPDEIARFLAEHRDDRS